MAGTTRTPFIPVDELTPFCGLLCCFHSFICKQPECEGCYTKDVCCCIYHEVVCCKQTTEPGYDRICYRLECMQGNCTTCRQSECQCLCYDFRCSALQVAEQPCICTFLFFTCYFDNKQACSCCSDVRKLKEVVNKDDTRAANIHQIIDAQINGGPESPHQPNPSFSQHGSSHGSQHGSAHRRPNAPPVATPRGVSASQLPEATVVVG